MADSEARAQNNVAQSDGLKNSKYNNEKTKTNIKKINNKNIKN